MIPEPSGRNTGPEQDPWLKKIRIMNGVVFAGLLLASQILMTPFFTLGVAMGGILILLNFHILHRILKKSFIPEHLASPKAVIIKYYLRLLGTGLILYFLISKKWVDPLGLLVGLSVVVINLMLLGCYEMRKFLFKEAN
jgi:ATP synthase I chain